MRNAFLLFFFLFWSQAVMGQTVLSSCTAPDSIISKYQDDADRLAVRKIYRNSLAFMDSVDIPKSHSNIVLNALVAVYNARSLAARDTVVSLLNLHTFPSPVLNEIVVVADSSLTWMKQLRQGNLVTANPAVNSLINKYNLKIYRYSNFIYNAMVVFEADSNYNIGAMANLFEAIPGVHYSHANGRGGDGNNIQDSIYVNHVELIYSYGFGDCMSGCINRRFWKFKVYYDCSVEYVGSYGSPIFVAGNNKTKEILKAEVYPNPAGKMLCVRGKNLQTLVITNLLGQTIKIIPTQDKATATVDISFLPKGVYLLEIRRKDGSFSRERFIKE